MLWVVAAITLIISGGLWVEVNQPDQAVAAVVIPHHTQPTPAKAGGGTVHIAKLGERCGGNMTNSPICGDGLHCAPTKGSHLPFGDVGGVCVAN
jgi:hypothetical protein